MSKPLYSRVGGAVYNPGVSTDFVQAINSGTSWSIGTTVLSGFLAASYFQGTRFQQIALNFAKYRVRRFLIEYCTSVAESAAGSLCLGMSTDPDYGVLPDSGQQTVAAMMSTGRALLFPVATGTGPGREGPFAYKEALNRVVLDCGSSDWLYTRNNTTALTNDPRTSCWGRFLLASNFVSPSNVGYGTVLIHWDVDFSDPISPSIAAVYGASQLAQPALNSPSNQFFSGSALTFDPDASLGVSMDAAHNIMTSQASGDVLVTQSSTANAAGNTGWNTVALDAFNSAVYYVAKYYATGAGSTSLIQYIVPAGLNLLKYALPYLTGTAGNTAPYLSIETFPRGALTVGDQLTNYAKSSCEKHVALHKDRRAKYDVVKTHVSAVISPSPSKMPSIYVREKDDDEDGEVVGTPKPSLRRKSYVDGQL